MAKSSKRPLKYHASRSRRPTRPDSEPEVIGDDEPARREPSLDALVEWLGQQKEPMQPVRAALEAVYGAPVDAKGELTTLKVIKRDDRLRIFRGSNGVNGVTLAVSAAAAAVNAAVDGVNAKTTGTKTLGDHVAAQKGKAQRITWPHDVGTSVQFLTDGYDPRKAIISNIKDHGGYTLYDLKVGDGVALDVPADRIARDLDAEGEVAQLRAHIAVLERHRDLGRTLAQQHVQMEATEVKLHDELSKHRKRMQEVANRLAEHARSEPGQTDLRDIVGDGTDKPKRGEKMKAKPAAKEDKLAEGARSEPGQITELDVLGWSVDRLIAARYERATASTGKAQQVKPIVRASDKAAFLVTDVQEGIATLLPLWSKKDWQQLQQSTYGHPLAVPTLDVPERLSKGGELNGTPVKVGRATLYLGGNDGALLVRLPPEEAAAPAKAVGKDAAAGA